jgi:dTDP-4-amino-4,6-dideoxygalactose transaminase
MIVNYIEKKPINWDSVKKYIGYSESINMFTNNGPVKNMLEDRLGYLLDLNDKKKYKVLCVNNGTSACNIIMHNCEKKSGKIKWLSDSYTFPSILTGGFDIKLCDLGDILKSLHGDKTIGGVILTYLFGTTPINFNEIVDYCSDNNLYLVLDIASSPIISEWLSPNDKTFYFGSLHHTKNIGFGEGGFVMCEKEQYDDLLRISNFGFDINRNYSLPSNNYKISDISAAFILQRLDDNEIIESTKNNFLRFVENINVEIYGYNKDNSKIMYGNIPLVFNRPVTVSEFRELGIEANKYYKPLTNTSKSMDLFQRIINLPLYPSLTNYQIDYMVEVTNKLYKK